MHNLKRKERLNTNCVKLNKIKQNKKAHVKTGYLGGCHNIKNNSAHGTHLIGNAIG